MHLMPPGSISQAASRAILTQNFQRRSCGVCYICDYVRMPQGGQDSSFLPESCSTHPSSVWLECLENGQLSRSNGRRIKMTKEGKDVVSREQTRYKNVASLELYGTHVVLIDLYTLPNDSDMIGRART